MGVRKARLLSGEGLMGVWQSVGVWSGGVSQFGSVPCLFFFVGVFSSSRSTREFPVLGDSPLKLQKKIKNIRHVSKLYDGY